MDLHGAAAALSAALHFLGSNYGGTMLSLVLIGWLSWRLHHCESRHEDAENHIDQLSAVVIELHGALAQYTGRRVVDVESLSTLLARDGRKRGGAIRYTSHPPADGDRRGPPPAA